MSAVSKGKKFEKEVEAILQRKGYITERAFNKTVFIGKGRIISVAHDFFSCWDLIAKKIGEPTLWVQVSTVGEVSHKRKKIAETNYQWNSDYDEPVIYGRAKGRPLHYRLYYGKDNYEWTGLTESVK